MEKSTVATLLIVVGLGGLVLWWYLNGNTTSPLVQNVPANPCSSTGEQVIGGTISAVGKFYSKGAVNTSPTQTCIGLSAAAKGTAKGVAGFLSNHTTTKSLVLLVPNTFDAPINAVSHPVNTGKGIYNAAKSALGGIF